MKFNYELMKGFLTCLAVSDKTICDYSKRNMKVSLDFFLTKFPEVINRSQKKFFLSRNRTQNPLE